MSRELLKIQSFILGYFISSKLIETMALTETMFHIWLIEILKGTKLYTWQLQVKTTTSRLVWSRTYVNSENKLQKTAESLHCHVTCSTISKKPTTHSCIITAYKISFTIKYLTFFFRISRDIRNKIKLIIALIIIWTVPYILLNKSYFNIEVKGISL